MLLSLLTPTSERPLYLAHLYELILAQKGEENWQWLICDDSLHPNPFFETLKDERVQYFYSSSAMNVGEKRELLAQKAQGEILVHLDDDDYYAPHYLHTVATRLQQYDFVSLSSWFCYASFNGQFFYWALSETLDSCFALNPVGEMVVVQDVAKEDDLKKRFGFCYAYRKEVVQKVSFEPLKLGEDLAFYNEVERQGFKIKQFADEEGIVIKIHHDMNLCRLFPQYRIPLFLAHKLFPEFKKHLTKNSPLVNSFTS